MMMTKKWIQLTETEKKLIEIAYLRNEQILSSTFNWKEILWPMLILSINILFYFLVPAACWLFIIIGIGCFLIIYERIKNWPVNKEQAFQSNQKIKPLLQYDSVEIYECQSSKALKINRDENALYLLEVEKDKTIVYWDYNDEMTTLLPNSEFSFFVDKDLSETLGNGIKLTGNKFVPFNFEIHPLELESLKLLPKHLEILDCSIDSFLEKVKKEYSK